MNGPTSLQVTQFQPTKNAYAVLFMRYVHLLSEVSISVVSSSGRCHSYNVCSWHCLALRIMQHSLLAGGVQNSTWRRREKDVSDLAASFIFRFSDVSVWYLYSSMQKQIFSFYRIFLFTNLSLAFIWVLVFRLRSRIYHSQIKVYKFYLILQGSAASSSLSLNCIIMNF
jgi:hypothetical protein